MADPIVETTEGKLRGIVTKNLDGGEFYSFLGIPYAKPPVGDLRFKAPQPMEPWTGVKDATKQGSQFYQKDTVRRTCGGTEDGLHLNVFTKKPIPQDSKTIPVMVWIHGGGFTEGTNNVEMYNPEFLMREDVVIVSVHYRIGLLGALQLEDPSLEVFGNNGLKDQIAALKWVQRNIRNFGGDSNNVTIFGESAGGASVGYLVLSPAAKGLFHKAISQSGAVLNYWAYGERFVKEFLKYIGKGDCSEKDALEYLRSLSVEKLYELQENYFKTMPSGPIGPLSPVAEQPNPTAVITKHPFEYLIAGDYNKVPILMGYNSNECIFMDSEVFKGTDITKSMESISHENVISRMLQIKKDSDACKKVCSKLKTFYEESETCKFDFVSDIMFVLGIIGCARNHAKTSDKPVYLYRISLDAGLNLLKKVANVKLPGAAHADELGYFFKTPFGSPEKGSPEDTYIRRFVKLWTNFAKYGNPTPEENDVGIIWKPFKEDSEYFLDIDKELVLQTDPANIRVQVWKEIFQANPKTAKYL